MSFASALSKLRRQRRISQETLAKALGISKSAVSMYECGKRVPDLETLEALADYFNVSLSAFSSKPDAGAHSNNVFELRGRNGIHIERELSDDEAERLAAMLDLLLPATDDRL